MTSESVIIIGAGWAGLAAAVRLSEKGIKVSLFESAKQAGGRARSVTFNDLTVDNGQHLLIGAYTECLHLMKTVGIDTSSALKRLPLLLTVVDQKYSTLRLKAPYLPAPLHLLYALITAKGLKLKDRLAAINFGLFLKKNNYQLKQDISVNELFKRTKQTDILIRQLWVPLCLSIMNTPTDDASANVFMRVFKDAFTNKKSDADLLVPTVDLSKLFPNAAIKYIETKGGSVYLKSRIEKINIEGNQVTSVTAKIDNKEETFNTSNIIVATAPQNINKLIAKHTNLESVSNKVEQYSYQPIVTVYLQYSQEVQLSQPMLGFSNTISQWAFDRGVLCEQRGLISVVISCDGPHMALDDDTLTQTVHNEILQNLIGSTALLNAFVIREKRATFACSVNINDIRPENKTDIKGLFIAGDYTNTHYPATLEGAVRSGITASSLIK